MATYWITVSGINEELIRLAMERHEEKQKLNIQSNKGGGTIRRNSASSM